MARLLRCSTLRLLPALASVLLACRESTAPDPQSALTRANVSGTFVLVRASGHPPGLVCFPPLDPPRGDIRSLGLLTFDTTRFVLRQQEVRLDCAKGDTVMVDQERPFRVSGPLVLFDRPASATASAVDTGAVIGQTLAIRREGIDLVYERVTPSDAAFFYRTSDLHSWAVGTASFTAGGPGGSNWVVATQPTHFTFSQRLFLSRPLGRPDPGTYPIGDALRGAPFTARLDRDSPLGGGIFGSVSGSITISESTPTRITGSFTIDLADGAGHSTRIDGHIVARCACL